MTGGFPRVGDTFGRYEIDGRLGHGGMGVVFSARQAGLGRAVALKVLSPVFAEETEFRGRFAREAGLLASVDSPHIIAIYDYGEQDGCLYIATQLVPGGDLGGRLQEGPLPLEEALLVATQLASALADAHRAGVVHRDVKPSNVLLRESPRLHAYVCDFGVARGHDDGLTKTGTVIGSVAYMSPEQCLGHPATPASDIYALGCLLTALLTGSPPYKGAEVEIAQAHLHDPIAQLSLPGTDWSHVNRILAQAMAKEPDQRYLSAEAMESDLREALDQLREPAASGLRTVEPNQADTILRPRVTSNAEHPGTKGTHPLPEPPARSGRRRRRSTALAAAALLLLVAGASAVALTRGADDDGAAGAAAAGTQPRATKTCWDGPAADTEACSNPEGLAGIRYVFPSFARAERRGECSAKPGDLNAPGKTDSWACTVTGPSGDPVQVVYGAWRSWRDASQHYRTKYAADGTRSDDFLVFGPSPVGNTRDALQSARLLARDYGFSVTVIARTREDVSAAMDTVRARALADIPT